MLLLAWSLGGLSQIEGRTDSVSRAMGIGTLAGFGCMVFNFLLDRTFRLAWGHQYVKRFQRFACDVIGHMGPLDAVAGGIMAGLGEEPIFRGVLLPACGPPYVGIVVSAIVFGLFHYLRREYLEFLVWGMGEGLIFGTLFVMSGSIVIPAVAHGLFDTVWFLYFERLRDRRTS